MTCKNIINKGIEWIDEFLPKARAEYDELLRSDIDSAYIAKERARTLAYNGTMLRILAGAHYQSQQHEPPLETDVLASFISSMNLQPKAKGGLLVKCGVLVPGEITLKRTQTRGRGGN